MANFCMALAQAMKAADFTLEDNDLMIFITTLNTEVAKRWHK